MSAAGVSRIRTWLRESLASRAGLLTILGLLLLLIQATAVWGILDSRRQAERVASLELQRSVEAQAATLEAALATLSGDLRYFVRSWTVVDAPQRLADEDPVTRRWSRLDLDGAALLFLDGHPSLARIYVERTNGELLTAVGWRQGAPVILRRDEIVAGPAAVDELHETIWPLVSRYQEPMGRVRVWLDPQKLIEETFPGVSGLGLVGQSAAAAVGEDERLVGAPVSAADWQLEQGWRLERRVSRDALLAGLQPVIGGFRRTLVFNLAIIAASAVLGFVLLRQTRRAATAQAELRHREQRLDLERQVQHSERLAAVGRLAAGVAHEINNPLSGVVNYLSLLESDLAAGDVDAARKLVGSVREGADRASEVVRRMLAFAEPGSGEREPFNLGAVAERSFDFVASNPSYRHLRLRHAPPASPMTVAGDTAAISQLILNLLLNAAEVQPYGGEVELILDRHDGNARIEVLDRGPGLTDEVRERMFEPFYSTRDSTGLGLAVCHGIVATHGGSIEAVNRPGGGAQLVVDLPLDRPDSDADGGEEAEPSIEKERQP